VRVRRAVRRLAAAGAACRLAGTYVAFGALKHVLSLSTLARLSWREPRRTLDPAGEQRVIGRAIWVRRAIGCTDRDCLQRSLVLYRELSRAGADPTLMVGFSKTGGGLRGHAWVVARGRAVAEPPDEVADFVPAFRFGRGGAPSGV